MPYAKKDCQRIHMAISNVIIFKLVYSLNVITGFFFLILVPNALRPKLLFVCGAQENEGLRPNGISYLPSGLVCPHLQLFAQRRQIDWQRENPVQKARHTERAFILALIETDF